MAQGSNGDAPEVVTVTINVDDRDAAQRLRLVAATLTHAERRVQEVERKLALAEERLARAETSPVIQGRRRS